MINGLDIYHSREELSYGKGLAPVSTNKNLKLLKVLTPFRQIKEDHVKKLDED